MSTQSDICYSWKLLFEVADESRIGLFVGAGLSVPNQLASWPDLTALLCDKTLSDESRDRVHRLEASGIPLASQLAVTHEQNAKNWIGRVRKVLYGSFLEQLRKIGKLSVDVLKKMEKKRESDLRVQEFFQTTNPALTQIVRMCVIPIKNNGFKPNPRIGAVLTTNLDSLIQLCDRALHGSPRILRTIERASKKADAGKISLYHLHGYLTPYEDAKPRDEAADRLVLTELEYTDRNDNSNHWAAITLHWALRELPIVFVGCSMKDDLVRRALYRTRTERVRDAKAEGSERRLMSASEPKHFVVCKYPNDEYVRENLLASYRLMDLNILWVRDFKCDLPCRLEELRTKLCKSGSRKD